MSENLKSDDRNWDNNSNPVPMNLTDSDFFEKILHIENFGEPITNSMPAAMVDDQRVGVTESEVFKGDEFSKLREQVKAEADAELEALKKAEAEEEDQRKRLEEWMANARRSRENAVEVLPEPTPSPAISSTPIQLNIELEDDDRYTALFSNSPGPNSKNTRLAIWIIVATIPIILMLGIYALMQLGHLPKLKKIVFGNSTIAFDAADAKAFENLSKGLSTVNSPPIKAGGKSVANIPKSLPAQDALAPEKSEEKLEPQSNSTLEDNGKSNIPSSSKPSVSEVAAAALEKSRRNADASLTGSIESNGSAQDGNSENVKLEIALKASVQKAMRNDAENIQGVFDRFSLGNPGLEGNIVIGVTVQPNGRIFTGTITSSTTKVASFDQEILSTVLNWKLKGFDSNLPRYISVPFHFDAKKGE